MNNINSNVCSKPLSSQLFVPHLCKDQPLIKRILFVAFHVLTLGIPLAIYKVISCCRPRHSEKQEYSCRLPAIAIPSVVSAREGEMAKIIQAVEEIPSLTSISGVPIELIEERARPNGEADSGFLGENESIKEVLSNDWKTVRMMGLTHIELADLLGQIAHVAGSEKSGLVKFKFPGKKFSDQNLILEYEQTKGTQSDIFRPQDAHEYHGGWSTHCNIKNIKTGAKVVWNPGIERYIRNYGFYEGGGKDNEYRVDPVNLLSILTGKTRKELIKEYNLQHISP